MKQSASTLEFMRPDMVDLAQWRNYRSSMRYQGSHRLRLRRPSRAPDHSRDYLPGDPPHLIDWKAYARTDQLTIREIRDEASVRAVIVIDGGDAMQWPDAPTRETSGQNQISKFECASRCALATAYLHVDQGDVVEIWLAREGERVPRLKFVPRSSSDIMGTFSLLEKKEFDFETMANTFLPTPNGPLRAEHVYIFSDGLGSLATDDLLRVGRKRAFMHVLSSLEVDPQWMDGNLCFFDESKVKREYQGNDLLENQAYIRALSNWRERLVQRTKSMQAQYQLLQETTGIGEFMGSIARLEAVEA